MLSIERLRSPEDRKAGSFRSAEHSLHLRTVMKVAHLAGGGGADEGAEGVGGGMVWSVAVGYGGKRGPPGVLLKRPRPYKGSNGVTTTLVIGAPAIKHEALLISLLAFQSYFRGKRLMLSHRIRNEPQQ